MPGIEKLHLEDALEDSPHTKSLVSLFEQDTKLLKKYIDVLFERCDEILKAQGILAEATCALSQHLRSYEQQNFPLDNDPESILQTTLKQFAETLDEMSSWQQACATQLTDGMMYPLNKFLEADFTEISTVGDSYHESKDDFESAVSKFCKIPRKKELEKVEVNEEVYITRKRFHKMALHYFANLNALQYKRKVALVEPLLGLIHAMKSHYTIGQESLNSQDLEAFLSNISSSVQGVHNELSEETQRTVAMMDSIEQQGQHLYYAEPPPDMPFIPPNTGHAQKSGYLFFKSKFAGMVTKWDRLFFYTLGGHLMSISKNEAAGSVVLEMDINVTAKVVDQEDRRNVFQIANKKRAVVLQALNERERDEWIATVHNVAREYSSTRSKQTAKERSKSLHVENISNLDSVQNDPPIRGKSLKSLHRSLTLPMDDYMMDTPIQFDMISPTEEDKIARGSKDGPPLYSVFTKTYISQRINPFDQSSANITTDGAKDNDSPVWEFYEGRFCGSMQVKADRGEQLVYETMQRIMAARAIHNLFKMCEIHLVITHQALRIVDPSHQTIRASIPLEDVSFWTTHKENNRLLGFITRTISNDGPPVFQCYVFETQASADEVCSALATVANIALKALMEFSQPMESSNLNCQSETLKGQPKFSADGQHLVLSHHEYNPQPHSYNESEA